MTFSTSKLAGGRVLVTGNDLYGNAGKVIVDGNQWAELQRAQADGEVHKQFDADVAAFFGPLTDAVDRLNAAHKPTIDPAFHVVLSEGREPVAGEAGVVADLTHDSVILRLIEENAQAPRLIWVGEGQLEVLELVSIDEDETVPVNGAGVTEF